MPAGGFGNSIALPLQNRPRQNGNSVFLEDDLRPYDDQWACLSTTVSQGAQLLIQTTKQTTICDKRRDFSVPTDPPATETGPGDSAAEWKQGVQPNEQRMKQTLETTAISYSSRVSPIHLRLV